MLEAMFFGNCRHTRLYSIIFYNSLCTTPYVNFNLLSLDFCTNFQFYDIYIYIFFLLVYFNYPRLIDFSKNSYWFCFFFVNNFFYYFDTKFVQTIKLKFKDFGWTQLTLNIRLSGPSMVTKQNKINSSAINCRVTLQYF